MKIKILHPVDILGTEYQPDQLVIVSDEELGASIVADGDAEQLDEGALGGFVVV